MWHALVTEETKNKKNKDSLASFEESLIKDAHKEIKAEKRLLSF